MLKRFQDEWDGRWENIRRGLFLCTAREIANIVEATKIQISRLQ